MNDSLDDLRQEYVVSAELLSEMIAHGNTLMQQARASGNTIRVRQLRDRQRDLYMQRMHVQQIVRELKNYYQRSA